jgi:hypothetical protein
MSDIDDFKHCCLVNGNVDLEALDDALIEPLRRFAGWWVKQGEKILAFISALSKATRGVNELERQAATGALKRFLQSITALASVELALDLVVALAGFAVGIGLGVFMDVVVKCIGLLT